MPMEPRWQKSSYCMHESDCVAVAKLSPETVGLRDTKQGDATPSFTLSSKEFMTLITSIKDGACDPVQP